MRRFNFRLEPFLRIRAYKEKNAELELARVVGTSMALQGHLQDVQREIHENTACSTGGIFLDLSDLQARNAFSKWLEKDLQTTKEKLAKIEMEREEKYQGYLLASRDRKVLEKLKERKAEEYYDAQWKEEFKMIDEVADRFVLEAKVEGGRE